MKFKGNPKQLVRFQTKNLRNGRKTGIRFDADGFYETEHPRLIKALSRKFEIVKEVVEAQEPVPEELQEEQSQEVVKEVVEEVVEDVKMYQCKKCDFKTDNRGVLMAHYRKEHN